MNTRTGKIARLPHTLREELNLRLADGEPAEELLDWLRELDAVEEVLDTYFSGRAITAQNLSAWKQGGFVDWQRAQEVRALAGRFVTEAEEVAAESGALPLADRLSAYVALTLAQLLRTTLDGAAPDRCAAVLKIAHELSRLRRGDHQQARVAFARERWATGRRDAEIAAEKAEEAAEDARMEKIQRATEKKADFMLWCFEQDVRNGTISAEERARKEAHFAAFPQLYGERWRTVAPAAPAPAKAKSVTKAPAKPAAFSAPGKPDSARPVQPAAVAPAAQGKSSLIKPNQGRSKAAKPTSAPAAPLAPAMSDPRPQAVAAASDSSPNGDPQSPMPAPGPRPPSANRTAHDC